MSLQSLAPDGDEGILIEIYYREEQNDVTIVANNRGLGYLRNIFQMLLEADTSGKHVHIAKYDNVLEGNVYELTLQKK